MLKTKLKTLKRVLSGSLAAVMCLGLVPVPAHAANADITDRAALIVAADDNVKGNALQGVKVRIECTSAGQYKDYGTQTTDGSGKIAIGEVPVGYYRLTPISAPEGFRIDPAPQLVYLSSSQGGSPIKTFTCYAERALIIKKVNPSTGDGMPGAQFTVKNSADQVVATLTTDSKGEASIVYMAPGTYTVEETYTPEGQYNTGAQKVTIRDHAEDNSVLVFYGTNKNILIVRLTDKMTGKPLEGAKFELKKSNAHIGTATTNKDGLAFFENVSAGSYHLSEISYPDGYLSDFTTREISFKADGSAVPVDVMNSKPGNVLVYSRDNNDKLLVGTKIQIFDDLGQKVGSVVTTNDGGYAAFPNLAPGSYTATATASEGYILVYSSRNFVVEKNKTTVVDFISQVQPSMLITCKNDKGVAVAGAEFTLQSGINGGISAYVTGPEGTVTIPHLAPGEYTVTMTSVPNPYVLSSVVESRTLMAGHQAKADFTVYEKPYLEIVHLVKGTRVPLAGAKFELYKGSERINEYVVPADGHIMIEDLEPGTYTVKHIATVDGYTVDTPSQAVTIQAGKSGYLEFTSARKSAIVIEKVDKQTGLPLAGAQFQIRRLDGTVLDTITTDTDGMATSIVLDAGQYMLSEIMAPTGYVMDEHSRIVTVKNNETSVERFTNEKKSAIVITARDYFKNPVANAVFSIVDSVTGVTMDTVTTDPNGIAITKVLTPGKYIVREISAPTGYVKETGTLYDVPVNGEGSTSVIFDHSLQTVIQILNETKNGDPISGGEFKVVNLNNGDVIGYFTTDASGIATTPILENGTYQVSQVKAASGYTTKNENYTVVVKDNKASIVRFVNAKMSIINIKKTDRVTGDPLADAVFTIANSSGHVVGRYTTDATGCLATQPLPADTYLVREYYAPEGYLIDDSCRTNVVLKEDENTTIEMTNRKAPVIQIVKEDAETGMLLAGAEFTVYNDKHQEVGTYITDSDGMTATKELAPGEYTVVETKAPAGYALNPVAHPVHVYAGETARLTVKDTRLVGLVINKVDEQGNPLMGAEFTIYKKNGSVLDTVTTDAFGAASYDNMVPGFYFVRETKAPDGFKLDASSHLIQIQENVGASLKVINKSMSSIIVNKVDAQTRSPLAGAHFVVTTQTGSEVASLVTDTDGVAQTGKLEDGVYLVKEVKAPQGYVVDEAVHTVTIAAGSSETLTITNTAKNSVYVHLIDASTKAELDGGSFVIRNSQNIVVGQGKTVNGLFVVTDLVPGEYIVSQIAAPNNYLKDTATQDFTIVVNNSTHVYFENLPMTGIVIEAVETTTHNPLDGCKFEVYNAAGKVVYENTTSDDGVLNTGILTPGRYTIKQVATKDGYSIVTSTQSVLVDNTMPIQVVFENQPLSALIIELVDKKDGSYLPGAEFKIQSVDGLFETEMVTDKGGMITIPNLKPGFYLVTQMTAPSKDYILGGTYQFAQVVYNNNTKLTFTNEKFTGLVIENVVVNSHEPLAGGKFEIWTLNETNKVFEGTTDSTGVLQTGLLEPGKYLIKHLATADGYTIVTATQIIEVKTYEAAHAVFENKPIGSLQINNVDKASRAPIEGVTFKVVKEDGSFEVTVSTDSNGTVRVNDLLPGNYVVTQIVVPNSYRLNNIAQNVVIKNGEMSELTFANEKLTGIIVHKTDAATGLALEGAQFEISHENGKSIGTFTTDSDGLIVTEILAPGKYIVKEIQAPAGYVMSEGAKTVTVTDTEPTHVYFTNRAKAGIVILKTDSKTDAPLEGAKFEVLDASNNVVEVLITDKAGRAESNALVPGKYTVKETQAPKGYILDESGHMVEVKTDTSSTLTLTNRKMAGIIIEKTDAVSGAPLAGAKFEVVMMNGQSVGTYETDDSGLIETEILAPGKYTVKEVKAPAGYVLDAVAQTAVVEDNEPARLYFTNNAKTGIVVNKTDSETGAPLEGAKFEIRNASNTLVETIVTDDSGVAETQVLDPGMYTVKEVKAPAGYILDSNVETVEVETDISTKVNMTNRKMTGIVITKVDFNSGKPLAGAQFEVAEVNGGIVGTYTTDESGKISTEVLKPGKYTVKEIKAPDGYVLDTAVQTAVVNDNEPAQLRFTNRAKVGITVIKTDSKTGAPLDKAVFEVRDAAGQLIEVITSDASGKATTQTLTPGMYTVTETTAPVGYILDTNSQVVEVKTGTGSMITMTNRKMTGIIIENTDADTGLPLAGTKFEIAKENGQSVGTYVTNDSGVIQTEELKPGKYIVTEVQAPAGYVIDTAVQTAIVGDNEPARLYFTNRAKTGIVVNKTDSHSGAPLEGAKFEVRNSSNILVETIITDSDGKAETKVLNPGMYTITEVKAPDGYILDEVAKTVEVKTAESSLINITNRKMAGIVIENVDAFTGAYLAGAQFTVSIENGKVIGTYTTDSTGIIETEILAPGKYTVKEVQAPAGYVIDTPAQTVIVGDNEPAKVRFTNRLKVGIVINKTDSETGTPLANAVFEIHDASNHLVETITTSADGKAETKVLIPGMYTVTEIKAPDGYILDENAKTVEVKTNESTTVNMTNRKMTGIIIYNTDAANGEPLKGAHFEISKENGDSIGVFETDETGIIETGVLAPGKYTVKEVQAPAGYVIDTPVQTAVVTDNEPVRLYFTNRAKACIEINKTDAATGLPLADAKFQIVNASGEVKATLVTDNAGHAETAVLEPGVYTVKEIQAPKGYILDEKVSVVEVKTGANTIVPVTNRKTSGIIIEKTDADTGLPLAGAKFQVTNANGGLVNTTYETDRAGLVQIPDLAPGKYTIKEIAAPDGYVLDSLPKTVTVTDGDAVVVPVTNKALSGILIEKVDSISKEPLKGAEFQVWNQNRTKLISTVITDDSGSAVVPALEPGVYVVKETKAPKGYLIDIPSKTVTVSANEATSVRFEDTPKASLMIEKVDANDPSKVLAGAQFTIYNDKGQYVGDYTTNDSGIVIIDNLNPGQYKINESRAPQGYQIDNSVRTINVMEAQQTKVTFTNKALTGIVITKVDTETNAPLEGAQFQISVLNGSIVNTYTTDSTGMIHTEALAPGQYVVKEVKAPAGYMIDDASQIVEVVAGQATNIQIGNSRMAGIEIKKIDATTNQPLEGAVFELCDSNGKKLAELRTDRTGYVTSDVLPAGEYILKEIQAPDGYVIDSTAKTVKVEANVVTKVTMTNSKMTSLQIWKQDAVTGAMLSGAAFEIRTASGEFVTTVTTGADGIAVVPEMIPGNYIVTETSAPEGYLLDSTPQTVTVATDTPAVLKFFDKPLAALRIQKIDGKTGESLSGAVFKITKVNGDYVGEFTTELDGIINLPTMDPGSYVITEISAPDGYIKDTTPRTVEVKTGTPTVVTIENNRVAGLQIRKTVTQTGDPLAGVTFKIKQATGELVGNYTTDSMGLIYVSLEPGEYTVQEIFAPDGYVMDGTPMFVTIKENEPVVMEITNDKLSEVKIHKIDAETGKGIYGVVFEIKDSHSNYIGTYTTDDQGYIDLSAVLADGKYVITEMKAADGYVIDPIPRTVTINHSEPTVITWENAREKGQVKVTKFSAEDNATLNIPKNSRLAGAQFTITTLSGQVVDVIETNVNGEAFSGALDLGTYLVQETKAPKGYAINTKAAQINVTSSNQKIDLAFYDNNLDVAVNIEKRGETQVRPGNSMKYFLMNIQNKSDAALDNFYVSDKLPTDAVRAQTLYTGTWSSTVYYQIEFKTNMYDYRVLAKNLNSQTQYSYDLSSVALDLQPGEYVTDIRFVMGTVPAGFHEVVSPVLYAYVLPHVPNNYQIINRCEVGGQFNGGWVTDADSWTTLVVKPQINLPDKLPTTGF